LKNLTKSEDLSLEMSILLMQNLSFYYMNLSCETSGGDTTIGRLFSKVSIVDEKSEILLFEMSGNGIDAKCELLPLR
jgi:hypothetical protein